MLNIKHPANGGYFYDVAQMASYVITQVKVHLSNSIYCPFCADEFMFDFSLQHHMEQNHDTELKKFIQNNDTQKIFPCTVCGATFYLSGLIPKHLAQHHGYDMLQQWRLDKQKVIDYEQNKNIEPSIIYAICSPGMSDIYQSLDQSKHASARRKLRYDELSNPLEIVTKLASRSSIFSSNIRNYSKLVFTDYNTSYKEINNSNKFLTSTPINFLDDSVSKIRRWSLLEEANCDYSLPDPSQLKFSKEKFQCARCKLTWDNNRDLLAHIKSTHRNFIKHLFDPKYRCSLCGVKYFRNKYLVKHCASAHAML